MRCGGCIVLWSGVVGIVGWCTCVLQISINTLMSSQNDRHFIDIFKLIILCESYSNLQTSLNFIPKGLIENKPSLVRVVSCRLYPVTRYYIPCNVAHHSLAYNARFTLRWRHNGLDGVSNHHLHDCLLNRLFRRRSKKTSKLRVTGLCVGNSPVTGEFPARRASSAENVSIWWRHHEPVCRFIGVATC